MDFEEWFESRDDIGCIIGLEGYAAEQAWNARQAEIDALKKRINKALELLRQPMQGTVADLLSDLEDILDDT